MRKISLVLSLLMLVICLFCGCGEKKLLQCDHCGGEVKVDADSNMTEDWIIYCQSCNEELFGDDPLLGNG